MLELAWIGLCAVRQGFASPAPGSYGAQPPEPSDPIEVFEAVVMPEPGSRAISAYNRAANLAAPASASLIDTRA
jgi:hypothetical protein